MTPNGLTFASPRSFGAPWYSGIDYKPVLDLIEEYNEGDICITNDSYAGNVATHSPDIHIWKPVFHEGRIVCFVVGHIHNTDVGGAVPASLSRTLTEIVQEGVRIPPLTIVSGGKMDENVARFGVDDVCAGIEEILDYGEAQARRIIETIPDGEYFYADYADEDSDDGYPCRIAITMRSRAASWNSIAPGPIRN